MKKVWLVILASLLMLSSCDYFASPPTFNLDHFKAYNIKIIKAEKPKDVSVQDQFIEKLVNKPITISLKKIKYFANPVNKNGEKIKDKFAHLAWYPILKDKERKEIKYRVKYSNQFTGFKVNEIVVHKLRALLVPSEKIIKNSKFPDKLDHYLCYQVVEGFDRAKRLTLVDQFPPEVKTAAGGPTYFCNPCSKNGKPINNNADHLAVYVLGTGKAINKDIVIKNQFTEQSLKVEDQIFLFVPSDKSDFFPDSGQPGD